MARSGIYPENAASDRLRFDYRFPNSPLHLKHARLSHLCVRRIMSVAGESDDRRLALSPPQGGRRVGGRKVRTPAVVSSQEPATAGQRAW